MGHTNHHLKRQRVNDDVEVTARQCEAAKDHDKDESNPSYLQHDARTLVFYPTPFSWAPLFGVR